MSGWEPMIKHFRNDCSRSSHFIQILEIFTDTGYKNCKICSIESAKQFRREVYWMKKLRTVYPNSPNESSRKYDSELPVGKLLLIISRTRQRSNRHRNNDDYLKNYTMTVLLTKIHIIIQNYIENFFS